MRSEEAGKAVILIVDDNLSNLQVLLDYLTASGFKTLIAEDGEESLEKAHFARPDIILLDIMMPGIDGFETCRRLKKDESTKDIPVIFMTAISETVDKIRGFEVGAVDYITKPFQQEEVLARITAHLTIRQQKQTLEELNGLLSQANTKLSEANAAKDKFFSIIAHDMKSSLNVLITGSKVLSGRFDTFSRNKIKIFSKEMHRSAQNAFKLLQNLLDWATSQMGEMEFEPRRMNLNTIILKNIALFQANAEYKKIDLSHSVAPDAMVYADPNMTNTIFRNLISNALKFTHGGGEVSVSAKTNGNVVDVSVSDTGVGISEECERELFRIDIKHKSIGTAGEKGTGLGLILCKELTEMNNGKLRLKSEVGKGTTFHLSLPRAT